MLSEFEARLVSVVGDLLAARAGLSVVQAGGAPDPLGAGAGRIAIGLADAAPDGTRGFAPGDRLPPSGDPPAASRVVPLTASVAIAFSRRAATAGDVGLRAARRALLEDLTLVLHGLDDQPVRTGAALATANPDSGFTVRSLSLATLTVALAPAGDQQAATATYAAELLVWPPGQAAEVGIISAADVLAEALPLQISVQPPVLAAGGTAAIRIRDVTGTRLSDVQTGAREPVQLAVGVRSDLPPADRGTLTGGAAAAVAGFRIVPVSEPETTVGYTAPAGPLGTVRGEEVVVCLATAGGGVGIRVGSVVVGLRAAP